MKEKQLMADKMRELTASAGYRKVIKEMQSLQRTFSKKRFVYISNPDEQTLELLKNEGFTCTKTPVKEYDQFQILW